MQFVIYLSLLFIGLNKLSFLYNEGLHDLNKTISLSLAFSLGGFQAVFDYNLIFSSHTVNKLYMQSGAVTDREGGADLHQH